MGKSKTLAQQIVDLTKSTPQDFDPEEEGPVQTSDDSSSEESDDDLAGTEHYAKVSKSKLRKPDDVVLGPKYTGSRISREALLNGYDDEAEGDGSDPDAELDSESGQDVKYAELDDEELDMDDDDEDIDSDNAFGESDQEKFKNFAFSGSSKRVVSNGVKKRPRAADFMSDSEDNDEEANDQGSEGDETDEDILDADEQHSGNFESSRDSSEDRSVVDLDDESAMDDIEAENVSDSDGSDDQLDEKARRAELRKIMGEEQKTVVATISQAAKADAEKGSAVKEQRKAFDSLLNIRMVLQKGLVATNSMALGGEKDREDILNQPYEAAEEAAIKLWNTLDKLRHDLSKAGPGAKAGQKRKRGVDSTTSSSALWERMQSSEITMIDNRQTTLEKWSAKVRGITSMPISRKLNPTAPQQSITSILQDQLVTSEHLIKRTKIPRSCAPIQRDLKLTEDPNIYDDGNFYQILLKELVDQRRVESLTAPAVGTAAKTWTAVKEAKTRNNVDTKASKGRKMRYTVHEKLQNFMAPEDRGSWASDAIDRFFGTLLGQKMSLGEEETDDEMEEENGSIAEDGLMLFRS